MENTNDNTSVSPKDSRNISGAIFVLIGSFYYVPQILVSMTISVWKSLHLCLPHEDLLTGMLWLCDIASMTNLMLFIFRYSIPGLGLIMLASIIIGMVSLYKNAKAQWTKVHSMFFIVWELIVLYMIFSLVYGFARMQYSKIHPEVSMPYEYQFDKNSSNDYSCNDTEYFKVIVQPLAKSYFINHIKAPAIDGRSIRFENGIKKWSIDDFWEATHLQSCKNKDGKSFYDFYTDLQFFNN